MNSRFTIYSKSGCVYCDKAKRLLYDKPLEVINCDTYLQSDKTEFLEIMKKLCRQEVSTFPMIFSGKHFIGGYAELLTFLKEIFD